MKTISFYSYKGGAGRTLAVVNVARFLARFGYCVAVIDLDLEAPGLHFKFGLRSHKTNTRSRLVGLVDLVENMEAEGSFPSIEKYLTKVTDLPPAAKKAKGSIYLLPAGNAPSEKYSSQLHQVRRILFETTMGDDKTGRYAVAVPFSYELKAQIQNCSLAPDYLLIDCRTGVTDIGRMAVRLMSDTFCCFVQNIPEDISGARRWIHSVTPTPTTKAPTVIVALTRIPLQSREKEDKLLNDVHAFLRNPNISVSSSRELPLPPVVPLHTESIDGHLTEDIRFGTNVTANESVLMRDYYKLFRALSIDAEASVDARRSLSILAEADRSPKLSPLFAENRTAYINASQYSDPIQRALTRTKPDLRVIHTVYTRGENYSNFVNLVVKNLLANHQDIISEIPLPAESVHFHLLAEGLLDGVYDFSKEPYWLSENRAHLADIIQFAWCETYTVCAPQGSEVLLSLNRVDKKLPFAEVVQCIRSLIQEFADLQLAVLSDTPSATEVGRVFSGYVLPKALINFSTEEEIVDWLQAGPMKLVLCDHVIAQKMRKIAKERQEKDSKEKGFVETDINLSYRSPIPVGIPLPKGDKTWRVAVARASARSLSQVLKEKKWETGDTSVKTDLLEAGLTALPAEVFASNLMLNLPFEEAIKWGAAFKRALGNSNSAIAAFGLLEPFTKRRSNDAQ